MAFNLADCFEVVAGTVPDRAALVAGDRRLTYGELDERASRLARWLATEGVGPDDHVGILAYNCTEWVETFIACFKVRAAAVNVNFRYTDDELRYLFADADLKAVVHGPEFDPPFDGPRLEIGEAYEKALAGESPEPDFAPRSGDDHYVIYTGGTTGYPKGVVWRHEDAFFAVFGGGNYAGEPVATEAELGERAATQPSLTYLITPPLMHGAGQWVTFGAGLLQGGKVVLLDGARFDPEHAWDLVEREGVQSITIVGDAMGRPLADALAAQPDRWDVTSLIVVGSGGAPLSPAVKEQLSSLLPNCFVIDSFGASETGYQGRATEGRRFAVGPECTVLDPDTLEPVPAGSGQVGMLAQGGRIPVGYYRDEEKTKKTFVEALGKRWSLPGDMATVEEDGTITLLGRGSQCINSGGEKIYPEEVEDALKGHPDVFDVLVAGAPDERWGETVSAVVQPRGAARPSLAELQEHCRSVLAGYKLPRRLYLVDQVSRQPSGKPDYPWARQLVRDRPPDEG